ncbi:MAG: pilus assembly protein CpaE [Burkholderiales bacterium]
MNNLRITLLTPDRHQLGEIERTLAGLVNGDRVTVIEGSLLRLGSQAKQLAADILIVHCRGDETDALAQLEPISKLHPHTAVLMLCGAPSSDFLIRAMRAGVREVLTSAPDAAALAAAIERVTAKATTVDANKAKVLAFMPCKGGSGATFLASNLAHTLAASGAGSVALLDLNLQFGDTHMYLSEHKPGHNLSDVVRGLHRLDAALLKASMMNLGPNLALLAAPDDPSLSLEVKPEHINALLSIARRQYDYVIVDVGRTLDAATVRTLDQADLIYAVLQANLPFVRGAKRMMDVFRTLDYPEQKVEFIANRYEKGQLGGDPGVQDIERALGTRIARTVPNHYEAVAASMNQGIPITRLARTSPVSKSLMAWSEQLQGKTVQESRGWMGRLLKRA